MKKIKFVTFFRYQGKIMALNHNVQNIDDFAILPVKKCVQYASFPDLMEAAVCDLKHRPDGKWIWIPASGWQHSPLSCKEEIACELALQD
ncbi:MAG: hypothetical protein QNJ63_15220 [Calothrix sp. MO_192.B10]|nr:hypothetical protein [Calothrix sp. MO_192.B10]